MKVECGSGNCPDDCHYCPNDIEEEETMEDGCKYCEYTMLESWKEPCRYCIRNGGSQENFKRREEKTVETVSTWEMVKMLMDNPKRKAKSSDYSNAVSIDEYGNMRLGTDYLYLSSNAIDTKWTIIEPVEKVSFAEAFKAFKNKTNTDIESCLTGKSWHYNNKLWEEVTDAEIDSEWIIKVVEV